ncbi:MAG: hypothetical protein FJ090_04945 [Deltaproteobacteria bacterium]|nr:hypothetical protein [Deltaproteobacteria bacterium]
MILSVALALAGGVYINGVKADVLPVMTMEDVSVRFDQSGNVWIDAPLYRVTVVSPAASQAAPAASYSAPPAAYSPPPSTSTPLAAYASPPAIYTAPVANYSAPPPSVAAPAVAPATWWLVTEDSDSSGHDVELLINGALVRQIRSGEGQVILDVGGWLRRGQNTVELRDAGTRYGGGGIVIYVGRGSDSGGTVRMDAPDVRYTRRATDLQSTGSKQFTLNVP